jgi:hypothetical protein
MLLACCYLLVSRYAATAAKATAAPKAAARGQSISSLHVCIEVDFVYVCSACLVLRPFCCGIEFQRQRTVPSYNGRLYIDSYFESLTVCVVGR